MSHKHIKLPRPTPTGDPGAAQEYAECCLCPQHGGWRCRTKGKYGGKSAFRPGPSDQRKKIAKIQWVLKHCRGRSEKWHVPHRTPCYLNFTLSKGFAQSRASVPFNSPVHTPSAPDKRGNMGVLPGLPPGPAPHLEHCRQPPRLTSSYPVGNRRPTSTENSRRRRRWENKTKWHTSITQRGDGIRARSHLPESQLWESYLLGPRTVFLVSGRDSLRQLSLCRARHDWRLGTKQKYR